MYQIHKRIADFCFIFFKLVFFCSMFSWFVLFFSHFRHKISDFESNNFKKILFFVTCFWHKQCDVFFHFEFMECGAVFITMLWISYVSGCFLDVFVCYSWKKNTKCFVCMFFHVVIFLTCFSCFFVHYFFCFCFEKAYGKCCKHTKKHQENVNFIFMKSMCFHHVWMIY